MQNKFLVLIALFALAVVLSGCINYGQQQTPSPTPTPTPTPTGEVKEFTIDEKAFAITPATITVNEGDTVKLTVISEDIQHTFTIDELGVNEPISAGAAKTFEFVASQKGTFKYYCAVDAHRAQGMEGTITVQ
ncbi:MAG TPA: cupredoxin domain-containing protein [Candidatus Nanoarchaeia archaeon]|nr:cupredoxin domain-containing protein [Candidatus Nanoarchaeia archaeon]